MKKIGILVEKDCRIFTWVKTREKLQSSGCELVWFVECPTNTQNRRLSVIPARIVWRTICWIEERFTGATFSAFLPKNYTPLNCHFSGHFKDFPSAEIKKIRDSGVDFLVRLSGRGIYRGEILNATPNGMISIHHGDNRAFRGGPPGFWEIIEKAPTTGFIVQRLTETLDGGEVLARGEIETAGYVSLNRKRIFAAADAALADTVETLVESGSLAQQETSSCRSGPIYLMPDITPLIQYLWTAWIVNTLKAPHKIMKATREKKSEALLPTAQNNDQ